LGAPVFIGVFRLAAFYEAAEQYQK
jgi:hypothetical protein